MDVVITPVNLRVCLTSNLFLFLSTVHNLWPAWKRDGGSHCGRRCLVQKVCFSCHTPTLSALRMNLGPCACSNVCCGLVLSPSAVRQTGCSRCRGWSRAELSSTPPRASSCSWFGMQNTPTSRRCFFLSVYIMPTLLHSALSLRHWNRRSETPEGSRTPDCEIKEKQKNDLRYRPFTHGRSCSVLFQVSFKWWDSRDNTCVPPPLLCPVLWVIKDRAGSFSPVMWCRFLLTSLISVQSVVDVNM